MTLEEQRHTIISEATAILALDVSIDTEFLHLILWLTSPIAVALVALMVASLWYPGCNYGIIILSLAAWAIIFLSERASQRMPRQGQYYSVLAKMTVLTHVPPSCSDETLQLVIEMSSLTDAEREPLKKVLRGCPKWLKTRIHNRAKTYISAEFATSQD